MIRNLLLLLILFLSLLGSASAQLAPLYPLTINNGTYTSISGTGTPVAIAADDAAVNITGLSPGFVVNGTTYTNARMCSNGWLILYTSTAPTTTTLYGTALSTATTNAAVIFAPMNADLHTSSAATTAAYTQTSGGVHIFEWQNFSRITPSVYTPGNDILNFQVRLNTSNNSVEFAYGSCTVGTVSTAAFQVGWKTNGATASNWSSDINNLMLDVTGSSNTCDWSNAVTGNANSSTMYLNTANPTVKPNSGLTFSWAPQSAPSPVRTFSAVSAITDNGATITWTAPAGATQYNIQYRAVGSCTWTNWANNPVAASTVTLTGLNANTTYQVRVQSSNGTNTSIYSHIPNQAGTGSGYIAAGTFTTAQLACSGTPEAGTISGLLIRPTCVGSAPSPAMAAATGYTSGFTGITFQWETSTDGTTWGNATGTGATSATYTLPNHIGGQTEYYRLKVTCSNGGATDVSDVVVQVTDPASPATQASNISTSALGITTATITWTNGSGSRRFVKINTVNSFTDPVNGTGPALTASTVYSGSGEQIVYDGTGSSVSVTGLTQGTTYYVRVYEYIRCGSSPSFTYYYNTSVATNNPGSFTTNVPPPGDVWTTAIEIPCGGTVFGNNSLMEGEVLPTSTCGSTSSSYSFHKGVWYKVTPTVSGAYSVNTCFATEFDTYLRVYTESASVLTCVGNTSGVGYDDDGCSESEIGLSQLSFTATANTTYYILLCSYYSDEYGLYSLTTTPICTPPANDECAGAIDLTPTDGVFTDPGIQNLMAATPSVVATECDPDFEPVMNDVWFSFTTDNDGNNPETATLIVTPSDPNTQLIVAVYDACGPGANEIDCNWSQNPGEAVTIVLTDNSGFSSDEIEVRDNETYYVKVHEIINRNTNFTFSLSGTALPVNLISFNAKAENSNSVLLSWNVAEEKGLKEYVVERSTDGRSFSAIGTLSASLRSAYTFIDERPALKINYYRLKMVDVDGSIGLSPVRQVVFGSGRTLALYPNPTSGNVFVTGLESANEAVSVSVFNELGQEVWSGRVQGEQLATRGIDMSAFSAGAYIIKVVANDITTSLRFIRQ